MWGIRRRQRGKEEGRCLSCVNCGKRLGGLPTFITGLSVQKEKVRQSVNKSMTPLGRLNWKDIREATNI